TTTSTERAAPVDSGSSTTSTPGASGVTTSSTPARSAGTTKTTKAATTATTTKRAAVSPILQVTSPPASTDTGEQPQAGGTLTFLANSEIRGMDPLVLSGGSAAGGGPQRGYAVYDMLVYQDPQSGGVSPGVAESVTSSDAQTWTMRLRPNVKFTDGTPFDSAAVKFNWQRI